MTEDVVETEAEATPTPAKTRKARSKGNGKAKSKPKKAKDGVQLDEYGLRVSSGKSQAVAMYASAKGATLGEVRKAVGGTQYNVLTQLRAKGYTIDEEQEDGNGNRKVTRYFIRSKAA